MAILASFGLPRANFYDWMTGNGCGYSVRVTPVLWMSGRVMEVYARLPLDRREEDEVIYAARQAAYEIIGDKRSGKEDPEDKSSDQ